MSPLPTNRLVTKIMRYLTEKYSSSRLPIVLAEDLIRDNELSKEEYQDLFHHLFRAGVFKPSGGKDRLQIDPLVTDYASRLDHCSLSDVSHFFQGHKRHQRMHQILQAVSAASDKTPAIAIQTLLTFRDVTAEGQLIEAVTTPWFDILDLILTEDPERIYRLGYRKWEEIIAGAYQQSGLFDDVILTPGSRDKGLPGRSFRDQPQQIVLELDHPPTACRQHDRGQLSVDEGLSLTREAKPPPDRARDAPPAKGVIAPLPTVMLIGRSQEIERGEAANLPGIVPETPGPET